MNYKPPQFSMIFAGHDDGEAMASFAQVVWAETIAELEAFDALEVRLKSRLATVGRYCRYRAEFEFLYPSYASEGAVKHGPNGDYVNLKYAMLGKLDDKLARYDEVFWRWCGGKTAKGVTANTTIPAAARKYLQRSTGH